MKPLENFFKSKGIFGINHGIVYNVGDIKEVKEKHDALYDVEATLEVCRLIKERCPDVWTTSLQTASKGDVYSKMDQDKVFCASRFFRGKEYTHGITWPRPSSEREKAS